MNKTIMTKKFLAALGTASAGMSGIMLAAIRVPIFLWSGATWSSANTVGATGIGVAILGCLLFAIVTVLTALKINLVHGFVFAIGAILLVFAVFYLSQGLTSPSPTIDVPALAAFIAAAAGILTVIYVKWAAGSLRQGSHMTGPESLVGKRGVAVTDLKPAGEVRAGGIVWRARSVSGDILKGEIVRVKSIEELELAVEKANSD